MKSIFIIFILMSSISAYGQSYSTLIGNSEIEDIIAFDLLKSSKRKEEKKGKRRLYHKILDWDTTLITSFEGLNRWQQNRHLFGPKNGLDTLISSEDRLYILEQCKAQKDTIWNSNFENVRIEKKPRKGQYSYSIPLFTKDRNLAIVSKFFYCGSLCAYGGTAVYRKNDLGEWFYWTTLNPWIS